MAGPFRDLEVKQGIGGLHIRARANLCGPNDTFHHFDINMDIADEPLKEIVKRGLERLAGQGKIDEDLRVMCHCVGEQRGK